MKARLTFLALVACALVISGCPSKPAGESDRTNVVVSIFPLYDLTKRVAGPDADVTSCFHREK